MARSSVARLAGSRLGTVLVLALTTALILAGVWFVGGFGSGTSEVELTGTVGAAPKAGEAAPAFRAVDVNGAEVSLAGLAGRPVWLVFGATWCSNCRAETADVQAVQEALGGDVAIVAVYIGESQATVSDYAARLGLTYTQVADSATALGSAYSVMGVPAHFFLDSNGVISSITVGAITAQTATAKLQGLLSA
jgi:peroxiredoxin